jgi:hypothetical protein
VGGLLLDLNGACLDCFGEPVRPEVLAAITSHDQKIAILELEGLAILTALRTFRDFFSRLKLVVFPDNQSVQACLVKCKSQNDNLDLIIRGICSFEEESDVMCWIEGVPSFSNPADALSRQEIQSYQGVPRSRVDLMQVWNLCKDEVILPSLNPGQDARLESRRNPHGQKCEPYTCHVLVPILSSEMRRNSNMFDEVLFHKELS